MATALTHAVVGAALATAAPSGIDRGRLALVLAAASVLPDADVIGFALGVPYAHPLGHRGLTHSLPFALAGGALLAGWLARGRGARVWMGVGVLGFVALASHGVLDAMTDGGRGVGFLIPFHDARYFLPWRPLRVSPIGIEEFFRHRAAREIVTREAGLVMLPVGVAAAAIAFVRRRRERSATSDRRIDPASDPLRTRSDRGTVGRRADGGAR
jgi:inner membrane protein